ncbi:enoyl-CoA hydratase/isomerase family protein [bacterium]|nr:enoyl-CoA hydratase/isomerase family protein [bacterium]
MGPVPIRWPLIQDLDGTGDATPIAPVLDAFPGLQHRTSTHLKRIKRMTADYKTIAWQRDGHIGILTLNQPDSMNALSPRLSAELADCVDRIPDEKNLRVVIFTGAGKAFSAGGDMDSFLLRSIARQENGGAGDLFSNSMSRRFLKIEIPVIAAINGAAIGGGFTLALTCDLRIAAESARFGAVFARVGLSPEYGSSYLLSRIIGLTKASELVLTARIFDAGEALDIGLLNEVTTPDNLLPRARELAGQIAALPPVAIRMAKRTLRHGLESTLSQALDYEELAETHCFSTLDHQEAVRSFLEKRTPEFQGR